MSDDDGMKELKELKEGLEASGFTCVTLGHPPGVCLRCGAQVPELAFDVCFVCAMWEDPESTDAELMRGTVTAFEYKHTFKMWIAGRRRWGKLVPPEHLINRIKKSIYDHIQEQLKPWIEMHEE